MSDVTDQYLREIEERCDKAMLYAKRIGAHGCDEQASCIQCADDGISLAEAVSELATDLPRVIGALRAERALTANHLAPATTALLKRAEDAEEAFREAQKRIAELEAELNWLAEHTINVREPLLYGSRDLFWYSPPVDEEGSPNGGPTLHEAIRAAMARERGGA